MLNPVAVKPSLILPDLHARWPFPLNRSPFAKTIPSETLAWIEGLGILSTTLRKKFQAANFGELVSIAYAHVSDPEKYRVCCDFVTVLFLVDDITDEMGVEEVRAVFAVARDALRNHDQPRPIGESPIGELHRSFSERLHKVSRQNAIESFLLNYDQYAKAVTAEAEDRETNKIRTLDSYLAIRRQTGGVMCCFTLHLLGAEVSDEILRDERVQRLEALGLDMICIGNDILSFNVEYARGDIHNAVVILMHERKLSIQEAIGFVDTLYQQMLDEFCRIAIRGPLASCDSMAMRNAMRMYVAGITSWVTANYEWSLDCRRYFPTGQNPTHTNWVVPLICQQK
ncbi:terpene cyclase [Favolaschia claudopus]|uniref:Terpene synthase n=1 Tax=Favolaschia claudopus TaxID=2862362 RepID=A0AAV9YZP2_9AGAR